MIVSSFVILACIVVINVIAASNARSSTQPQWDNIYGIANHACYNRGGIQQIVIVGYGAGGQDPGVICQNHWGFDLYDLGWQG